MAGPAQQTDPETIGAALLDAFETASPVAQLTVEHPQLSLDDAYAIQRALIAGHARLGRKVVGRKVGLTSRAMQRQLGVDTPDFGVLLDSHVWPSGSRLSRSEAGMIAPKLEPELAFVLSRELSGPDLSIDDVLAATESIVPVMEVIDSRIRDWKLTLPDTVADNASCFGAILGTPVPLAETRSLPDVTATLSRGGTVLEEGRGEAVLGHPAAAVAWLAQALDAFGEAVPAGQPILAGSFTAAVDLEPGAYVADFGPAHGAVELTVEP